MAGSGAAARCVIVLGGIALGGVVACATVLDISDDDETPRTEGGALQDGAPAPAAVDAEAGALPDAAPDADGATCIPFACPAGVTLCDAFDGTPATWTSTGTTILDTTLFAPCSGPRSLRASAAAATASSRYSKSLGTNSSGEIANQTLDFELFPRVSGLTTGRVTLATFRWTDAVCANQSDGYLSLTATTAGLSIQTCPNQAGCGGSTCTAPVVISALPPEEWVHVRITGQFKPSGSGVTIKVGANERTASLPAFSSFFNLELRLGVETFDGAAATSANYDNVVLRSP